MVTLNETETAAEGRDTLFQRGTRFDGIEHRARVGALGFHPVDRGGAHLLELAIGIGDRGAVERFGDRFGAGRLRPGAQPRRRERIGGLTGGERGRDQRGDEGKRQGGCGFHGVIPEMRWPETRSNPRAGHPCGGGLKKA